MADLSLTDWGVIISLIVSLASFVLWVLTYLSQRQEARSTVQKNERENLEDELRMYQDIARGNKWNWKPNGGFGHPEYPQWVAWTQRCIGYAPFVAESMKPDYQKWVNRLGGRYQGTEDYNLLYNTVLTQAEAKVNELTQSLNKTKPKRR